MSATLHPVDHLPAVRDFLLADAALLSACTGGAISPAGRAAEARIYAEVLPAPPIVSADFPRLLPATLVLASAGGAGNQRLAALAVARVELRAYETSRGRARALFFQALRALCRGPRFDAARGLTFEALAPGLPIVDAELGSEFVVARAMVALTLIYH